jgi:ABC-type branched-subunit amino acid transport system ATPase component
VARQGISRTFQNLRLFENLTTFDNVEIAVDSAARHRSHTEGPSTAALLADFDLVRLADRKVSTLAQGDRRRVELARAVGLRPQFVLLDEPTAGLNDQESGNLLERFRTVQQALGFGAVVVDHNIPFVMNLCQRLYVLDSGRLLASGSPSEIQDHPEVIDAYLGKRRGMSAGGRTTVSDPRATADR